MNEEWSAEKPQEWLESQAAVSLMRIWQNVQLKQNPRPGENLDVFYGRLSGEWPRLFALLYRLYGTRYDFFYHLQELVAAMLSSWTERCQALHELDAKRLAKPAWILDQHMLGGIAYVDLFAGNLEGLRQRIPYLKEWGITYLHLMPLFKSPEAHNDGGYAVSDYRTVDPALGTMTQLREFADELRQSGISLVLDFVFNHTSDEHAWAVRARAGEQTYLDYYLTFSDRCLPDAYERTMREIFPTVRRGSFTWNAELSRWVWTTFHSYQWDLNYANPDVFRAMAAEMLFLANAGVEVLRLDAVAFIWKRMDTDCENQPEAHWLVQAMNAVARIAAPALLFKSEAIVHPDEVVKYVGTGECQLSYNPLLMALLWESLATREVKLLAHSIRTRFALPEATSWVNYVRCHDDIGWTFDDADAAAIGIDGFGHRRFLNDYYMGRFKGSPARGVPFQENPATGDARVCGMLASLAGLESALEGESGVHAGDEGLPVEVELAVKRILLLHAVILSAGGIPLIYLNDETATLNDYSYRNDPVKEEDSRWVHRVATDWTRVEAIADAANGKAAILDGRLRAEAAVYHGLKNLVAVRKKETAFAGQGIRVLESGNPHVLVYEREGFAERDVVVYANFSEVTQESNYVYDSGPLGCGVDLITGEEIAHGVAVRLEAYQVQWVVRRG